MVELCTDLGVSWLQFGLISPTGRALRNRELALAPELRIEWIKYIENLEKTGVSQVRCPLGAGCDKIDFQKGRDCLTSVSGRCAAGTIYLYIASNGDVYPCTNLCNHHWKIGNIRNEPLKRLWQSAKLEPVRDRLRVPQHCIGCDLLEICRGGCPAIYGI